MYANASMYAFYFSPLPTNNNINLNKQSIFSLASSFFRLVYMEWIESVICDVPTQLNIITHTSWCYLILLVKPSSSVYIYVTYANIYFAIRSVCYFIYCAFYSLLSVLFHYFVVLHFFIRIEYSNIRIRIY